MKKLCLIICLSICWLAKGQTSTYYPFPTDSAAWYLSHGVGAIDFSGSSTGYKFKFYIKGDTVLNGVNYKTVATLSRKSYHNNNSGYTSYYPPVFYTNPVAIYREENKKIYVQYLNQITNISIFDEYVDLPIFNEHVLYDFNQNIGDSLLYYYQDSSYTNCKLISIDSVLANSVYRKQYNYHNMGHYFSASDNVRVIEGIGSDVGGLFMDIFYANSIANTWQSLTCFQENGLFLYGQDDCYTAPLGIEEDILDSKVSIYPNPATSIINLEFASPKSFVSYKLYSSTCQQVKVGLINNQKTEISVNDFSTGIYLLQLIPIDSDRPIYRRVIVN